MAGLTVLNRLPCHLYTHTSDVVPTAAVEHYRCLIFISFISKQTSQTPHSQCIVKPTITQADISDGVD